MTVALTRWQRALLLAVAALSYLLWSGPLAEVLLAHDGERSASATWSAERSRHAPPVGSVIRRDPFAGKPLPPTGSSAAGSIIRVPDIGQVPPADFATREPGSALETFELKATIAGERALAYVQDGKTIEIVHVGSRLGERTIKRIGLNGIGFSDGSTLELASRSTFAAARFAPVTKARTEIDELRKLIVNALRQRLPAKAGADSTVAVPSVKPASPSGQSLATMPPASALPTIVPDFLPVGVSPTSDPSGPTPYPLPPLRPSH